MGRSKLFKGFAMAGLLANLIGPSAWAYGPKVPSWNDAKNTVTAPVNGAKQIGGAIVSGAKQAGNAISKGLSQGQGVGRQIARDPRFVLRPPVISQPATPARTSLPKPVSQVIMGTLPPKPVLPGTKHPGSVGAIIDTGIAVGKSVAPKMSNSERPIMLPEPIDRAALRTNRVASGGALELPTASRVAAPSLPALGREIGQTERRGGELVKRAAPVVQQGGRVVFATAEQLFENFANGRGGGGYGNSVFHKGDIHTPGKDEPLIGDNGANDPQPGSTPTPAPKDDEPAKKPKPILGSAYLH